ncbi:MAG: adenylate/guanylate cyclase domain-containing protein [Spirulina sp. SIO3F2]|nr:adenylate/guanylate cyclase domain-containing protein [Spirulina sp. SIO3F2]
MNSIVTLSQRTEAFFDRWLTRLQGSVNWEVKDYPTWQRHFLRRRLKLTTIVVALIALNISATHSFYALMQGENDPFYFWMGVVILSALLGCWLFLNSSLGQRRLYFVFFLLFGIVSGLVPTIDLYFGDAKFDWFQWTMAFFTQATLIPIHWRFHAIAQSIALTYYLMLAHLSGIDIFLPSDNILTISTAIFWLCSVCNFSVFLYERLMKEEFKSRRESALGYEKLILEKERSEALLLNVLPYSIAQRLKATKKIIADDFSEVTVLFADIVNFTPLSTSMSPTDLVKMLNQIFSEFDRLAEKHQLEKIKTIGDAYMVVGGLPEPMADHTETIAKMSLDMQACLAQFNQDNQKDLSLRIGIHTGSVVAGVIGLKKFAYDLWGDTVNTASRMESHGVPGRIQVTEEVYAVLKDQYHLEKRGGITIKGKGEMQTYFLEGCKA